MNTMEQLAHELRRAYPGARVGLDERLRADGHWWLDFSLGSNRAEIEWIPKQGFGVSVNSPAYFGERSDEFYLTVERTLERLKTLIDSGKRTEREFENFVRAIRESRKLTQTELARRLKIKQASISKMEHRSDMHISTLCAYLGKLGADVEIRAVFPDGDVKIIEFEARCSAAKTKKKKVQLRKRAKSNSVRTPERQKHETGSS